MPTIGQKLEKARCGRGLSIEDASHDTRIHPSMIALIEDDDFSRFPSVAYAKSFIRKYSEYLDVDLEAAMGALEAGESGRLGDNELMGEMKRTIKKDSLFRLERRPRFRRRPDKPGGAPILLNLVLALLIAALAVFYFLGYNASTPEAAREEIARGLRRANPFGEETADGRDFPANPLRAGVPETEAIAQEPVPAEAANRPEPLAEAPAPGTPPDYPPIKAEVRLDLDDAPRDPSAVAAPANGAPSGGSLRPRETPVLGLAEEAIAPPALGAEDLPAVKKPRPEPQAQLRPDGTDPASTTKRQGDVREPVQEPVQAEPPAPQAPAIRAVPVAAFE